MINVMKLWKCWGLTILGTMTTPPRAKAELLALDYGNKLVLVWDAVAGGHEFSIPFVWKTWTLTCPTFINKENRDYKAPVAPKQLPTQSKRWVGLKYTVMITCKKYDQLKSLSVFPQQRSTSGARLSVGRWNVGLTTPSWKFYYFVLSRATKGQEEPASQLLFEGDVESWGDDRTRSASRNLQNKW